MKNKNINAEEITAKETLTVIKAGNAMVKTLCSPLGDDQSWTGLLQQIAQPQTHRLARAVDETRIDRSQIYNPKTNTWMRRDIQNKPRGRDKATPFTKKTSLTLLPDDGIMHLFQPANAAYRNTLGLLFDATQCHLKDEKYIFATNQNTHARWWLKQRDKSTRKHKVTKSISFDALKKELKTARHRGEIPQHNDIMAGVANSAVIGIFTLEDTLEERLNALAKQALVENHLKKRLPIFIISAETGVKEYTLADQACDIKRAENAKSSETENAKLLAQTLNSIEHKESILAAANAMPVSVKPLADSPIELLDLPAEIQFALLQYLPGNDLENLQQAVRTDKRHSYLRGVSDKALVDNLINILHQLQITTARYSRGEDLSKFHQRLIKENLTEIIAFILKHANILNHEALIKDLQFHLVKANPAAAQWLFNMMLFNADNIYAPLMFNLLELGLKPINEKMERTIGQKADDAWDSETTIYSSSKKWTPLLMKLYSLNSTALERLIFSKLPEEVGVLLSGISDIHDKMLHDTSFKYDYKLEQIAAMRLRFLEKLSPEHHYIASSSDKRFLEKHLLEQIVAIDNLPDLQKFRQEKSRLYLMQQRRHPVFDAIRATFFKPTATTLEQRFLTAIEIKNLELGGSSMMVVATSATMQCKPLNDSKEETFTRSYLRNRPLFIA